MDFNERKKDGHDLILEYQYSNAWEAEQKVRKLSVF
jgi:hypothetical protein